MSADLEITTAEAGDARALGEVMVKAMASHMVDRFMIPEQDPLAAFEAKVNWFIGSYAATSIDPTRRIFKATLRSTGEIVGLGAIHYHNGEFVSPAAAAATKAEADDERQETRAGNIEDPAALPAAISAQVYTPPGFAEFYFGRIEEIHKKHMQGVKHIGKSIGLRLSTGTFFLTPFFPVWTTLHVKPQFQGKGVGGAMLRWGFEKYALDKEKVWLGTQMRGRNVYRRFGFEDVDHLDVDLSEWGGKLRGFGIHRSPLMLRQPGEFKKIEGIVDE